MCEKGRERELKISFKLTFFPPRSRTLRNYSRNKSLRAVTELRYAIRQINVNIPRTYARPAILPRDTLHGVRQCRRTSPIIANASFRDHREVIGVAARMRAGKRAWRGDY